MKRNRQHIIEEESVKAFRNIVPDTWVINEFTKDYGKDFHVEIFKNEEATGKLFIAQVKGSDQPSKNNSLSVNIKIDTLRYYQDLEYPVLLVFYSTMKKKLYGIWANNLLSTVKIQSRQKTLLVTMSQQHEIGQAFFDHLEQEFVPMIASIVNVNINATSDTAKLIEGRIMRWLKAYFPHSHRIKQFQYPRELEILIDERDNQLFLTFSQSSETLQLRPISLSEPHVWMYKPRVDETAIDLQEMQIVYEIANRFARSHVSHAIRLFKFVVPYLPDPVPIVGILQLGMEAIDANCINELDELIAACLDAESYEQFIYANYAYFTREEFHHKYSNNLQNGFKVFKDTYAGAEIAYSLGNYYRHHQYYEEAAKYYLDCRRRNSDYLNRNYWWHEYAGILFLSGHHKWAAACYQKALSLPDIDQLSIFSSYLLADIYFHLGQFQQAKEQLDDHMQKVADMDRLPSGSALLLHSACMYLIKRQLSDNTIDKLLSDQLTQQGIDNNDGTFFEKAIELNPLNDLAWFNAGITYAKQDKHDLGYKAFEVSALLQDSDRLTWFMCFICAMNSNEPTLCMLITQRCMDSFGDNVINDFTQFVHDKTSLPIEKMAEILGFFDANMKRIEEEYMPNMYQFPKKTIRIQPFGSLQK